MNLTIRDLEISRSAQEMLPWVLETLKQLGSTDEGKTAIRLGIGPAKYLVEESLPIAIFAQRHFGHNPDVQIKQVIGSQNYDAIVADMSKEESPIKYLEVTQAHEEEAGYLKMIKLERDGRVNPIGRVEKSGTKNTGISVKVKNEEKSPDDILKAELSRIADAVNRKCNKKYLFNTGLLIAFDDRLAVRSYEDVAALDRMVKKDFIGKLTGFRWFSLVGWGQHVFLEYDLKKEEMNSSQIQPFMMNSEELKRDMFN